MSDKLPAVVSPIPRDLRAFLDRVRDLVRATGRNRLITADDLEALNLATIGAQGNLRPAVEVSAFLTTPPAPQNVSATGAVQSIIVEWDPPVYIGHAHSEVWSAGVDDIGQAVLLGMTPGAIFVDSTGPSATRYYWARFVNTEDTKGAFNGISGTVATTGSDLAYTMGLLSDAFGGTSAAPFFQIDQPTVIGGVTIPAGTYIKSAFIFDGVITNAKIGTAAIDDAKIANLSAGKITTGFLSADRIVTGSLDAKIANIDAAVITSGFIQTARIQDASITAAKIVDATITTAKIQDATITTAKIADTLQSTNYAAGTDGWRINKAGTMELNSATFRGTIDVRSGATGARLEIKNNVIKVFDEFGVLRVRIGDLTA